MEHPSLPIHPIYGFNQRSSHAEIKPGVVRIPCLRCLPPLITHGLPMVVEAKLPDEFVEEYGMKLLSESTTAEGKTIFTWRGARGLRRPGPRRAVARRRHLQPVVAHDVGCGDAGACPW